MEIYLTIWDAVLGPVYLAVLLWFAVRIRNKHYPVGHPLRKYYLPGLLVKFGGAIFVALLIQYYYGSGDTYNFYTHSRIINSSLDESLTTWLKLVFRVSPDADPYLYHYTSQMYWYNDRSSYGVSVIGAIFGLLNGTTYIPIALLFAFFSYTGIWAMYRTFVNIYPAFYKQLAFAFLFVPSTVVWGSGFLKDTACMFGLGWMTYTVFRVLTHRDYSPKNISLLLFSFYVIALIKVYILVAFMPALAIWLLMRYSRRFKSRAVRWAFNAFFIASSLGAFIFVSQSLSDKLGRYSLEHLATSAIETKNWITYVSNNESGSGYDLGEFEPTLTGMLSKFPDAVVVTFFRPFLWEVKKPIMALSALEGFALFCLVVFVFYRRGVVNTIRMATNDPNLLFFLVYSLIFAFAVGISTGNFGTLSRYKIPCMPFFTAFLLILLSRQSTAVKKEQKKRFAGQRLMQQDSLR